MPSTMSTDIELKPEHLELVENVAKKEGFVTYEIELSNGSVKGENYLSHIYFVTIEEKNNSKSLHIVLKVASDDENIRTLVPFITTGFAREIYLYDTVLPALLEFQKRHNIPNKFDTLARKYASDLTFSKEIVIFENVKSKNFSMWNRKFPMNEEHISLVLKEYGKFHAISLAMNDLDSKQFESLTASMGNIWIPDKEETVKKMFPFIHHAFDSADKTLTEFEEERKRLRRFKDGLSDFLVNEISVSSEDDLVVTHGDCWCNNMLFKYEDPDNQRKPTKVCLIDWQLSRKASPTRDLAYFLCCSVSGKDLSKNIDNYLKIYHDALSENLKAFGCDVDKLLPYSLLEKHWKKYSRFGLYMAITLMRILVHEPDEARTLEDFHDPNATPREVFGTNVLKNINLFNERMRDIVFFMVERKYI